MRGFYRTMVLPSTHVHTDSRTFPPTALCYHPPHLGGSHGPVRQGGDGARWKPVHLGHAVVLRSLCERADSVVIGIGSSNRYNLKNSFTYEETAEMIGLVLAGRKNFSLQPVPDLDDGPRWRLMVQELFGDLDLFLTDNPYVADLMKGLYEVSRPVELVPPEQRIAVEGTRVRLEMARGGDWARLVPPEVAKVMRDRKLDERFRKEFGLEALASLVAVVAG